MKKTLKNVFKKLSVAALAVAGLVGTTVSADEGPVKVGGNFDLSGDASAYGTPMAEAFELALEQRQEEGGVLGRELEWVVLDNKSDKTEAATVANQLVSEGVVGVVGPAPTGTVLATFPVMTDAKVPAVFPAATGDDLTVDEDGNVFEYLFRVCFEDRYQGIAGAQFVYDNLGAKTVAVLEDTDNDYSLGLSEAFQEKFKELGGEVVVVESYTTGTSDFSTVLTNLSIHEFDVLYAPGYYPEVGPMIQQARQMGLTMPVVGGDGYSNSTLVELAGKENATDVYYTSHFSELNEDEKVQKFLADFEEKYNKTADTFAALAYDATNLLLDAVERAGSTDPEAVKDALAETKDFDGVTGKFSFDELHNPVKPALMLKLDNGEVVDTVEVNVE